MKRILRYVAVGVIMAVTATAAMAQSQRWRDIHKVKKKETLFGIARDYGLTVQELIDANPDMNTPGYELKKDTYVYIPYAKGTSSAAAVPAQSAPRPAPEAPVAKSDVGKRAIKLGVMLPLHDVNGDGRRMVEYYRGVLMACDSLRKRGISVDVKAWNTPDDEDIAPVLREKAARQCDVIIGPLYSKQMAQLSAFVEQHDIRLFIPFSINAPQLTTNSHILQVYQSPNNFNESVITEFMKHFQGCHPVFIDCNDTTSQKGIFTFGLRRQLEARGIDYGITNLKSSESMFAKSFSATKRNVVILNTGRSPELNVAIAKLNGLKTAKPGLQLTLFGYTDWLLYTKYQLDNFYKFDTYIPATFFYNPLTSKTLRVEQKYRWNFHQDMMIAQPRFAITGFDHAMFLLLGIHQYGKNFSGAPGLVAYDPAQTPLKFERMGGGGLRNRSLLFVHYLPDHRVETIER